MNAFLEIALRVPPLVIIDHILVTNFGTKKQSHFEFMRRQVDHFLFNESIPDQSHDSTNITGSEDVDLHKNKTTYLTVNLNLLVFFFSFTLFLLATKHIKRFYLCMVSVSILLASNYSNSIFINFLRSHTDKINDKLSIFDYELIKASLVSYVAQLFFAEVLYLITPSSLSTSSNENFYIKKPLSRLLFITPTILGVLLQPSANLLHRVSVGITIIVCFDLLTNWMRFDVYKVVTEDYTWCKHVIKYHGLLYLLEFQWQRLMIPKVLKIFWLAKFIYQLLVILVMLVVNSNYFNSINQSNHPISQGDILLFIIKQLLISGCETIICVSGMSSILSGILNKLGELIQKFLVAVDDGEDRQLGKISAILFFVLALQTGLTEISAEQRFVRLYRNLCLLLTANFYIIHSIVSPILLTLSASKNRSFNRHARPLIICFLLMTFPLWFFYFLWKNNTLSTWLLAVSTFCIEVVIKVNLTLLIYALYMIDACRVTLWERLDDYVFYIKSMQSAIQFVFSIFIFCNGAWILIYESGGAIRAMMISIHAYFNIWTQAKEGWKVFSKRRKAVSKLDLLKDATPEQLNELNDICAICYQELTSAKITQCNHFFHATCLRKWLNQGDNCPLCLQVMFASIKNETDDSEPDASQQSNSNMTSSFDSTALTYAPLPGATNSSLHPTLEASDSSSSLSSPSGTSSSHLMLGHDQILEFTNTED